MGDAPFEIRNHPAEMVGDEMASYVAQGFTAVKMKTGRWSPQGEESRVKVEEL